VLLATGDLILKTGMQSAVECLGVMIALVTKGGAGSLFCSDSETVPLRRDSPPDHNLGSFQISGSLSSS
jgi:hypothetical protein